MANSVKFFLSLIASAFLLQFNTQSGLIRAVFAFDLGTILPMVGLCFFGLTYYYYFSGHEFVVKKENVKGLTAFSFWFLFLKSIAITSLGIYFLGLIAAPGTFIIQCVFVYLFLFQFVSRRVRERNRYGGQCGFCGGSSQVDGEVARCTTCGAHCGEAMSVNTAKMLQVPSMIIIGVLVPLYFEFGRSGRAAGDGIIMILILFPASFLLVYLLSSLVLEVKVWYKKKWF